MHWKASARWILKYLWHHCFFSSCVYTSCKQSRSCFHGNIYLCEEFIKEFRVEIPRRIQIGKKEEGLLQCYFLTECYYLWDATYFWCIVVNPCLLPLFPRQLKVCCATLWHLNFKENWNEDTLNANKGHYMSYPFARGMREWPNESLFYLAALSHAHREKQWGCVW